MRDTTHKPEPQSELDMPIWAAVAFEGPRLTNVTHHEAARFVFEGNDRGCVVMTAEAARRVGAGGMIPVLD